MLAWVLLNSERLTEAEKVYRELVDVEKCSTEDLLNLGYCCWFQGNVSEAVQYFHQCKLQGTNIREVFTEDESLIERYQKNYVDRLLMIDIVENDSYQ
jgi:Flp pilus assembly protein TadD